MILREIEFLNKFWTFSGGVTLIQELLMAMIHRRILSINRVKYGQQLVISREHLLYCNAAVHSLTQLGYMFRSFVLDGNDESQLLKKLTEVIAEYKTIVRGINKRIRILFTHEPRDDETSKTLLIKITNDPETIPYYRLVAIDLITIYVCYLQVMIITIATVKHYGQPIGINQQVIYNLIVELRSISDALEDMTINQEELVAPDRKGSSPMYLYCRKFHYLIETFHHNQQFQIQIPPELPPPPVPENQQTERKKE